MKFVPVIIGLVPLDPALPALPALPLLPLVPPVPEDPLVPEVPLLPETQTGTHTGASGSHGDLHLTFPNNIVIGIKRDVTVYRFFWPRKDSIEYTMYTRVGVQIEQADCWVVVKNVKVAS